MLKLDKALTALEAIYEKPHESDRSNIDATIQRFEFTFELFWKTLKVFLYDQGLEANYPKEVLQESYKAGIFNDEQMWLRMLKDRNLTSHTYDEDLADEIFERIQGYVPLLRSAYEKLTNLASISI